MISGLPQQGQPLDLQYISELASSIVKLREDIQSNAYSKTYVKNQDSTPKNGKTANFSFYAIFEPVITGNISPGSVHKFDHKFQPSFTIQPVVTATPVNYGGTTIAEDVSVVITHVDQGSVRGWVKFNNKVAGDASLGLNIIAIGIQGSVS
jgi:hypothetical protein